MGVMVLSLALSVLLTRFSRDHAAKLGQLDNPGERKIHSVPIPVTGGIAIFASFAITSLVLSCQIKSTTPTFYSFVGFTTVTEGYIDSKAFIALLATVAGMHIMGLIDDRKGLGPYVKLLVQVALATALILATDIHVLKHLGTVPSFALTLLWFIVITNAFNFLDNMNGLSAGVATICCSILMFTAIANGTPDTPLLCGCLIGSMLGFLVYNYPKATIFMGDGGSLVIGFVIAYLSITVTYYNPDASESASASLRNWHSVFTPLIILAIPLYDLTSVTIIRLAQGKSPFVGDTQHFSHRLVRRGLSRPIAVAVIWACTLATGLGGIILGHLERWQASLVIIQTVAILFVLLLLERTPNHPDSEL